VTHFTSSSLDHDLSASSLQHLQHCNERQGGFDIVHFDRFTSTPAFYPQFLKLNSSSEAEKAHELELGEGRTAPCDTLLLGASAAFPGKRRGSTQYLTPTPRMDLRIKAFLQESYCIRH